VLPAAVDGVVQWVGSMNLLLLAFNLIPAFPLDGGRVLRAGLWHVTGDMYRATRWAAAAGRAFGAAFVAAGFVLAVFVGSLSGLWLALIGFFVMSAADAELDLVQAARALGAVRVGDVMVADPVTVPADLPLDRFFDDVFMRHRHTAYPVVGRQPRTTTSHEPVGMISFRDALQVPREQWPATPVSQRMMPLEQVLVIDADRPLADALPELARDDLHRALVRRSGRLNGLLSVTDAARVLEAADDARARRPHRAPRDPIAHPGTSRAGARVVPTAWTP
jgi:CBS domain-containing protein